MHVIYYLYEAEQSFEYFFDPTLKATIEEDFTGYSFSMFGYLKKVNIKPLLLQIKSNRFK